MSGDTRAEPHPVVAKLRGTDQRSIGRATQVVADVLAEPDLFAPLFAAMLASDPVLWMRAADAVEKITARRPDLLRPYKRQLLSEVAAVPQQEVRWHVAQMLSRLRLDAGERSEAAALLRGYLGDDSAIVRTCAMQARADLARPDNALRSEVVGLQERLTETASPAMRSRGRKLLAALRHDPTR